MKVLLIVLTLCSISWCDKSPIVEKFLEKFGEYEFQDENNHSVVKSYYASRKTVVTWLDAFMMCKAFGMDLVELPTAVEASHFLTLCDQRPRLGREDFHVGATCIGAGTYDYYWMTTEKRVSYSLMWGPGEPNNQGEAKCLSVNNGYGSFKFNDIFCDPFKSNFFCQHINITSQCTPTPNEW